MPCSPAYETRCSRLPSTAGHSSSYAPQQPKPGHPPVLHPPARSSTLSPPCLDQLVAGADDKPSNSSIRLSAACIFLAGRPALLRRDMVYDGAGDVDKDRLQVSITTKNSSGDSLPPRSPRAPRFAEATSVNSPVDGPTAQGLAPFAQPAMSNSNHYQPQAQPGDVGFGYIGNGSPSDRNSGIEMPATPASPLKSAMKSPGAPPRKIEAALFSPTFMEEQKLEREEKRTERQQAIDLKQKIRVRTAKMFLRVTNFSCSLIVLSLLASTFTIVNSTKHLPLRNNLPPWSKQTVQWPQITVLVISCVSLVASIIVLIAYWKGGHHRAEKAAVYYSGFAVCFFVFSIVMWAIGAAVLQQARNNSNGNDIWGWACKDNQRKALYGTDIQYDVVCRMQNWSLLCCLIEVVVEVLTILIYGVVFYRYYSKRKLRKSMAVRDRARSDLYLAQLRSQSAPNTPGLNSPRFGPLSPTEGGYNPMFSPRFAAAKDEKAHDDLSNAEEGNVRYVSAPNAMPSAKPFTLQAPPVKNTTPKLAQEGFGSRPTTPGNNSSTPPIPQQAEPVPTVQPAAPGEQQYAAVAIPGAYNTVTSPQYAPPHGQTFGTGQ